MSPSTEPAILVRGLVKRYGALTAVDGLDLRLERRQCLGLLGPNGAGKTTTIEILEGLTDADAGEIRILGHDWRASAQLIREKIGVQLQSTELQGKLSVRETLRLFQSFYRAPRSVEEVLGWIGLEEKARTRVDALSGGQKQRLSLGCSLIGAPELLFLDEPTTGLDPQARRRVWEIVESFKQEGGSVLLTTHYMEEAERLADDLLIIDHGRVLARGSPDVIIAGLGADQIVEVRFGDESVPADFRAESMAALEGVLSVQREGNGIRLSVRRLQQSIVPILAFLEQAGVPVTDLGTHRPTLEDVFVSLTGKHLRDA